MPSVSCYKNIALDRLKQDPHIFFFSRQFQLDIKKILKNYYISTHLGHHVGSRGGSPGLVGMEPACLSGATPGVDVSPSAACSMEPGIPLCSVLGILSQ